MPIKGDGGGEHWTRTKGWRMPMMYVVENTGGNLSRHRRLVGAISSLSFLFLSLYIYILSFLSSQWKKKSKFPTSLTLKFPKKKRREKEKGRQKIPRTFKFKQNQENPRNERAQWVVGIVSTTTTTKSSSKQNPVSSAAQKALFKTPPSFFGIRKSRRYPLLLLPSVTRALSGYTAD